MHFCNCEAGKKRKMDEDTFLLGAVTAVCLLAVCLKRRRRSRRQMWVNPYDRMVADTTT